MAAKRRHERPIPRTNPSGKRVWVARPTGRSGKRTYVGTFDRKGACPEPNDRMDCCAQHAIDAFYDVEYGGGPRGASTVGGYLPVWLEAHPRSARTNATNEHRVGRVLDVEIERRKLRDWPLADLDRGHALELVGKLLVDQGRSQRGAVNILRSLSAMAENAIDDRIMRTNPFRGVTVRANDPRITKRPKGKRVWSFEEMRAFAAAAGAAQTGRKLVMGDDGEAQRVPSALDRWRPVYAEPMLRVLSDCGLRLGELLPIERDDLKLGPCGVPQCPVTGPHLHLRRTAHEGVTQDGTKTTHGLAGMEGERLVPIPPALEAMLRALPPRIDTQLVFPTPEGRLFRERNFYRDVWNPARKATGMDCTPHGFRHSWISLLRPELQRAGIDDADLADVAGHTLETMRAHYTHPLRQSFDAIRTAVG